MTPAALLQVTIWCRFDLSSFVVLVCAFLELFQLAPFVLSRQSHTHDVVVCGSPDTRVQRTLQIA